MVVISDPPSAKTRSASAPVGAPQYAHWSLQPVENTHFKPTAWKSKFGEWNDLSALPEDQQIRAAVYQLDRFSFSGEGTEATVRSAIYGITWTLCRLPDWIFHGTTGIPHGASVVSPLAAYAAATSPFATKVVRFVEASRGEKRPDEGRGLKAWRNASRFLRPPARLVRLLAKPITWPVAKAWQSERGVKLRMAAKVDLQRSQLGLNTTPGRFATGFGGAIPAMVFIGLVHPALAIPALGGILAINFAVGAGLVIGAARVGFSYFPKESERALKAVGRGIGRVLPFGRAWRATKSTAVGWLRRNHHRDQTDVPAVDQKLDALRKRNAEITEILNHYDKTGELLDLSEQTQGDDGAEPGTNKHAKAGREGEPTVESLISDAPEPIDDEIEGKPRLRHLNGSEVTELTETMIGPEPTENNQARANWNYVAAKVKSLARGDIDDVQFLTDEGVPAVIALAVRDYVVATEKIGGKVNLNFAKFGPRLQRTVAEALDLSGLDARHNGLPLVRGQAHKIVDRYLDGTSGASAGRRAEMAQVLVDNGRIVDGRIVVPAAAAKSFMAAHGPSSKAKDADVKRALAQAMSGFHPRPRPQPTPPPVGHSDVTKPGAGRSNGSPAAHLHAQRRLAGDIANALASVNGHGYGQVANATRQLVDAWRQAPVVNSGLVERLETAADGLDPADPATQDHFAATLAAVQSGYGQQTPAQGHLTHGLRI